MGGHTCVAITRQDKRLQSEFIPRLEEAVERGLRSSISGSLRVSAPDASSNPPTFRQAKCHPPFAKGGMGFGAAWGRSSNFPPFGAQQRRG